MTETLDQMTRQADALKGQMQELDRLTESLGSRMASAFASAAVQGKGLSDVLKGLALSLARMALSQALRPLSALLGGLTGGLLRNAAGNAFAGGQVVPFADGGIVNSPTLFALRGATGLMGEAGPEAVMPLARGPDGRLGVRGGGGAASHVTVNISTPDAASFQRSQAQVAAAIARAVARGQRNL